MASDIPKYDAPSPRTVLGLRENLPQFMLLVAVNAPVGGTLGQERTVLPLSPHRNSTWTSTPAR